MKDYKNTVWPTNLCRHYIRAQAQGLILKNNARMIMEENDFWKKINL